MFHAERPWFSEGYRRGGMRGAGTEKMYDVQFSYLSTRNFPQNRVGVGHMFSWYDSSLFDRKSRGFVKLRPCNLVEMGLVLLTDCLL